MEVRVFSWAPCEACEAPPKMAISLHRGDLDGLPGDHPRVIGDKEQQRLHDIAHLATVIQHLPSPMLSETFLAKLGHGRVGVHDAWGDAVDADSAGSEFAGERDR